MENRGVHEPQEERVFQKVLRWLPADAVMVEAGCYWAFYSMWFNKVVTRPRNIMIEPIPANLDRARQNFAANGMQGEYEEGFVGAEDATGVGGVPIVSVDGLARRHGLKRIDILHADVQGAELEMVQGADRLLSNKQVNWVFVSTHSEQLHADCLAALRAHSMKIVASHKPDESFSVDGLVVAKAPGVPGPDEIVVSKRRRRTASPKRDEEAGRI